MKESYELIEVRGTEDTIDFIQLAVHFEKDDEIVSTFTSCPLMSSLDPDADEDLLIHSALNAIGSGDLRKMRKNAKEQFDQLTSPVIHYSKRTSEVGSVYVQLALIELEYFLQINDATSKESLYLTAAPIWKKTNLIMQKAMSHMTTEQINEVFDRAYQLQKEANIRDVFE